MNFLGAFVDNDDLRKAGLKVTLPRLRILEILAQNPEKHMSAEDIYKTLMDMGDEVGLATVYRVLTQFESAGLVNRLNFESGQAVFELNHGPHHDHLVCVQCNAVEEFVDELIEARQKEIAKKFGYEMTDHALNIYGLCKRCRK
jgi:Fur family ferric uptake transcriptional regulator